MEKSSYTKILLLFSVFFICLFPLKFNGQCMTLSITTTSASCSNCCDGAATATITGGCPNYTIQWNSTPMQYGTSCTGLCPGNYSVTVSDAGCCPTVSYTFQARYAGQTTGLVDLHENLLDILISNPNQGDINIYYNHPNKQQLYEVQILDIQSQIVYSNNFTFNNQNYSFKHNLADGVYFIEVKENLTNKYFKKKIIINN